MDYLRESIELANNYNYLDRLYEVYPMASNIRRNINKEILKLLKDNYINKKNKDLIRNSFNLELFPIKDAYVAFLKSCPNAIENNPQTINRLSGMMYEMGWDKFLENITEPKETNRQMGNLFKEWLKKGCLGAPFLNEDDFFNTQENAILDLSDVECGRIAREKFNFSREKGLDFFARFNKKYIIGEAKFLTAYGGHQNAQLEDAISTIDASIKDGVHSLAILDGVCYIEGNNKMFKTVMSKGKNNKIVSSLLLRDFLYQF